MKTAKANRDEVRENSFTVMSTNAEKMSYIQEASRLGLSLSAWVRMILNEKISQK